MVQQHEDEDLKNSPAVLVMEVDYFQTNIEEKITAQLETLTEKIQKQAK